MRERRGKIIVIFIHLLESVFQIITVDSFIVGSDWFLESRFYTRDTFRFSGWIVKTISGEGDKCFSFFVLYFGVSSSCLYCKDWCSILIWLFVTHFSVLVGDSLVSLLIIIELFIWSGRLVIFTLALKGFPL